MQERSPSTDDSVSHAALSQSKSSVPPISTSRESQKTLLSARATDSARVMKFKKELSAPTVTLGTRISTCVFMLVCQLIPDKVHSYIHYLDMHLKAVILCHNV